MDTIIIGIAGGTASGKTTIAEKLHRKTKKYGSVIIIKLDDYYNDLTDLSMDERRKINYDHPDAYDVKLLCSHLKLLKNGEGINKPVYDFIAHNRSTKTEAIEPSNVIILEGILPLAIPEIRELLDIKIFVDTPDDIRFIRRLQRDINDRGRDINSVINQYLQTVRPMHLQFIEPSKRYANLIVPEGGNNEVAIDVIAAKIGKILGTE
jgi:uridine kinase